MSEDDFKIHCGKCDFESNMEAFDTGIGGLWQCPDCGAEFGCMSIDRLSPKQKNILRECHTSIGYARSSFECWRSTGKPITPDDAMALLHRIDAGVIKTVGKTMSKLIETEGRKTFMEEVKGQEVDQGLLLDMLTPPIDEDAHNWAHRRACSANYATLRKARYKAGQLACGEIASAIASVGQQRFPLLKWS